MIPFDKKILVFEDIDCMADIILERNKEMKPSSEKDGNESNVVTKNELLNTIKEGFNRDSTQNDFVSIMNKDSEKDELTLSYILNVIDGIRETPGRIMIITSNHYNKLDKAFTRPGRIDISLEMRNASVNTIQEIVRHYYNEDIPRSILQKIKSETISPASLINMRFKAKDLLYSKRILQTFGLKIITFFWWSSSTNSACFDKSMIYYITVVF